MNNNRLYNPDVLLTLANLSSDEVFTSPELANQMLDLLPESIWSDKNAKFLDPVSKTGVFLREITKRLIKGLQNEIPDLQYRINHILTNQVYGIAITELTSLISRRTLYCSKNANSKYSITTAFDSKDGNIFYEDIEHTWKNARCIYCGASQNQYKRNTDLESHAYLFIHKKIPKEFKDMKFDVIVGNPPYQISDGGGTGDSAKPIYNLFVDMAKKLNPNYIVFIIPSRWMKGGKGLTEFRKKMIEDKRIRIIHDYENAKECFPAIDLDGGVNYFLWQSDYQGKTYYFYHAIDGEIYESKRYLKNEFSDTVVRDYRQITIIEKTSTVQKKFSDIVSNRNHYGFSSDLFNRPQNYGYKKISNESFNNSIKVYGIKGKKGGAKRVFGYIPRFDIKKNGKDVDYYKLFFSKAYMTSATVPPKLILGKPMSIATETFLQIGPFETKEISLNVFSYIRTKFFRALLFFNRHSLNISKSSFDLIPLLDFSKKWNDAELNKLFDLNEDEIHYIEELVEVMEDGFDNLEGE